MQAGASARERLKEAAAQAWGVDRAQVKAKQGVLTAGNHSGTYAEFATAAAAITLAEEPAIKTPGPVVAARQAGPAPGCRRQGRRQRQLPDRHASARHGLRRRQGLPRSLGRA